MKTLFLLLCFTYCHLSFAKDQLSIERPQWERGKEKPIAVRLYPNPSYDGNITISSNHGQPLTFYVFDVDGKMIFQTTLLPKQKQTIYGLKKGTYMYNVQNKDENIDGGKIIIK
jgi:hypothetical protein